MVKPIFSQEDKILGELRMIVDSVRQLNLDLEENGQLNSTVWCKTDGIEKLLDELIDDLGGASHAANEID